MSSRSLPIDVPERDHPGRTTFFAIAPAMLRLLRYAWAFPATAVGLLATVAALCAGATVCGVEGVLEVAGGRVGRLVSVIPSARRFVAITLGHVVIGIDHRTLACVRAHEHVHVRQYERWGALFFVLYIGSSLIQRFRGRDPYLNNRFEREAFAIDCIPSTSVAATIAREAGR